MPLISVCIITFRRPDGLKRLVDSLAEQRFEKTSGAQVEIIIVDNDETGPMREMVEAYQRDFPWTLKYDIEPTKGIPFARNRTLDNVDAASDYVVFVDDDEVANPEWLDELVHASVAFDAPIVMGAVDSHYPDGAPNWIDTDVFFDWRRFEDGEALDEGATSNALIKTEIVRELNLRFDERMKRNGGDDFVFFKQAQLAGYGIIGAAKARVCEWQPKTRLTQEWILQRRFRTGNGLALADRLLAPSPMKYGTRFVKALGRLALGAALYLPALVRGRKYRLLALSDIYWGAGSIAGLIGMNYEEYKAIHSMSGVTVER